MNLRLFPGKKMLALLLLSGLWPGNNSWGNPGVVPQPKTFVLDPGQYPGELRKYNPAEIYLLYNGKYISSSKSNSLSFFLRGDTVINLRGFADSLGTGIEGYRLIFENRRSGDSIWQTKTQSGLKTFLIRPGFLDSVWQTDTQFRITDKAYPAAGFLKI